MDTAFHLAKSLVRHTSRSNYDTPRDVPQKCIRLQNKTTTFYSETCLHQWGGTTIKNGSSWLKRQQNLAEMNATHCQTMKMGEIQDHVTKKNSSEEQSANVKKSSQIRNLCVNNTTGGWVDSVSANSIAHHPSTGNDVPP